LLLIISYLNLKFLLNYFQDYSARAGTFLPFGLGTRLCPGNDLAKLEISIFLHQFLLGYKYAVYTETNSNPGSHLVFWFSNSWSRNELLFVQM
jgi:cytochrome P450